MSPISPPTSVSATPISTSDFYLYWGTATGSISGYDVEQSTDDVNWTTIASPNSSTLNYPAPGPFTTDGVYYFRVAATGNGNDSDFVYTGAVYLTPGFGYVGSVAVPSNGSTVYSGQTLQSGATYLIQASGTVVLNDQTGQFLGDANYGIYTDNLNVGISNSLSSGLKYGVFINGSTPGWGAYNINHTYSVSVAGTGQPLSFYYSDDHYPDNAGSLTLEISLINPSIRIAAGASPILIASSDGTQNLEPVKLYGISNLPNGTHVDLSDSAANLGYVWDTPSANDTPILGGPSGPSSLEWTVGTDTIPTELWVGATAGSTTVGALALTLSAPQSGSQPSTQPLTPVEIDLDELGKTLPNVTNVTQNWIIGQEATLVANIDNAPHNLQSAIKYDWTPLPANTDLSYDMSAQSGGLVQVPDNQNNIGKHAGTLQLFWTTATAPGAPAVVTLQVTIDGKSYTEKTYFNVQAPMATPEPVAGKVMIHDTPWLISIPGIGPTMDYFNTQLTQGNGNTAYMNVTGQQGEWDFMQLVIPNYDDTGSVNGGASQPYTFTLNNQKVSDVHFPYGRKPGDPSYQTNGAKGKFGDAPGPTLKKLNEQKFEGRDALPTTENTYDQFFLYVIYKPPAVGGADSQWVPIAEMKWTINLQNMVKQQDGSWKFQTTVGGVVSNSPKGTPGTDQGWGSPDFPSWSANITSGEYKLKT